MYINTGYEITNTPSNFKAGYNTSVYNAPHADWYERNERYYIDAEGNVQTWDSWNPPVTMQLPGGMWKGTPTRTGGYYTQNTIIDPRKIPNAEPRRCNCK